MFSGRKISNMPPILPPFACDARAVASACPGGDATWDLMAFSVSIHHEEEWRLIAALSWAAPDSQGYKTACSLYRWDK